MAPINSAVVASTSSSRLDSAQTLRASTALLRKIQSSDSTTTTRSKAEKSNLLADADEQDASDEVPVWLILTTKKHIIDKKRLKPAKITLPHPYLDLQDETLRICLITADPQRKYKDLLDDPGFPAELRKRISRIVGVEKLKAKYKAFESKRQLLGEYDIFLADDRVITSLPTVLGKTFYKGGSKRPIPVSLEGKRQSVDEQGNKRQKLSEGGKKVVRRDIKPQDIAHEIERAVSSALVHLAPSTTTAVKVGRATMEPSHVQANIETVTSALVEKHVPQQWKNVKSIHIKGPNTAALPIYMAEELWADEKDVLAEKPAEKEKSKKRKNGVLVGGEPAVIEVPGPDGKMRRLEAPGTKSESKTENVEVAKKPAKKAKKNANAVEEVDETAVEKALEKAEKAARKEAIKKQKEEAKSVVVEAAPAVEATEKTKGNGEGKKGVKKSARVNASDLV
ncbi:proteasome-interacting protein cic1 [Recurvomyces mirabilis]|uniref:Proteasome-interacting protein cic1 n=1 Tax=Recurvomyces mirabilis TaxID=574656 RepID=A0AAE0WGZ5_9PEZI|nr:proteasome-interacting protein cic1 [Recurvomyces mirabilis]KAK5156412.1 proteasome-interacting protein cic1 [Recurvomyces mirabilis]